MSASTIPQGAKPPHGRSRGHRRVSSHHAIGALLLGGLAALVYGSPPVAQAQELNFFGFVAGRATAVESRASWLTGSFGRLDLGANAVGAEDEIATGKLHAALEWQPNEHFLAYIHGFGRAEPSDHGGDSFGLVEVYVEGQATLRDADRARLRLGYFLPPTSQENVESAWASPYTVTLSAINSWIAEEVRLTGLLADYSFALGSVDSLQIGAIGFAGNDASGALLAWRGWSFGDRLTGLGEVVPLPPLDSLTTGGFRAQRDDGSQPFGSDLDGRPGLGGFLRFVRPEALTIQATHLDTRGDRALHGGEYAWRTRIDLLGVTWHPSPRWDVVGEFLTGETGMGILGSTRAEADIEASYLLASWHNARFRITVRYDRFETVEQDFTDAETNTEDGTAWTLAAFWEIRNSVRLGVQLLDLEADRPAAAQSGFAANTDGRSALIELRWYFGGR